VLLSLDSGDIEAISVLCSDVDFRVFFFSCVGVLFITYF
jgi:hypothetical protein